MATAGDICKAAARHLGVIDPDETLSGSEMAHLMSLLISLLDQMQASPAMSTGTVELTRTPVAGTQSFTIGPAGDVVAAQPLSIVSAYTRVNGIDMGVNVRTLDEYIAEPDKTVQALTQFVVLDRGYDTATVYLFPAADGLTQIRLVVQQDVLAGYAGIVSTDTLTLPPGMQNMLEWAVAEQAIPDFGVDPSVGSFVVGQAARSKRLFGRANVQRRVLSQDLSRPYDINVG